MHKKVRVVSAVIAASLILGLLASIALAGAPDIKPHLEFVGFDTLGEPSTGYNSEVAVDSEEDIVYVGALFGDNDVKVVDVSDPSNPTMIAQVTVEGNAGPFDVKLAGDIVAASTQGSPDSNPGIALIDVKTPANPIVASHLGPADIKSPDGSHNSYLWADPATDKTWLFGCGLDDTSLMLFDVSDPYSPVFTAEYDNGAPFVHDCFTQMNEGRVLHYQAGSIGVEILDVTGVVRGGQTTLSTADVVGKNHYTSDPADAETVTRPGFAHYVEPNASGTVAWVGDESGCGKAAIVHSFDSTNPPAPGGTPKFLPELGTIIANPDVVQCSGAINGNPTNNSQLHNFRWTGHNFDIWGDELLVRGNYGKGVDVWDISDPAAAAQVAKSRGLNRGTGEENQADPGRDKSLENPTFIWGAKYDGDLIYAADINQGLYVLDLLGD
jgi:hypothetical protein